jgi:hypothetical protein
MVFVAGKGGTGKTTIAAALALIAARRGKRVLGIEVDAKGDLAQALGHKPVGFTPVAIQQNLSVLELLPEQSFQEYLSVFFKVPRFARLTPLRPVLDFIATGVPGPRDMLVIGKIAWEERKRDDDGGPLWDIVIVDCTASGHVLPQLTAPRAMRQLVRGGIIANQVEWVDAAVSDPMKSALCICALPEEMPVVEAIELHDAARKARIPLGVTFLNRSLHLGMTARDRDLLELLCRPEHAGAVAHKLGVPLQRIADGADLGEALTAAAHPFVKRLRQGVSTPVVEVPVVASRPGMATTREIAKRIEGGAS